MRLSLGLVPLHTLYCTLVINPAPLVTCDAFASLEVPAEPQKCHDRAKISADNCLFRYILGLKVVNFEETSVATARLGLAELS